MRIFVPYYSQITDVHCGPAVVSMVLAYFGIKAPSQARLGQIMGTDLFGENGTRHGEIANYLRSKGLIARATRNSSFKNIEESLGRRLPVIVHYLEPDENDDHYSIVTGITKTHITLNDPWNDKNLRFSRKEFLKRWRGKASLYTRWMLVARLS